ncbi:MAG TPA: dihydrodipicolinate synthase family protein, partial [Candidatus Caccocola faecipullorum]|nr:dihydrodipicolinate synthase family protein [Candidatus Caccocola faecipullorum]
GGILATSNLLPKLWADLFDLIQAGELKKASEIVIKVTPVLRLIFAESNPGPLKEAMKMIGIDCGDALLPLEKPGKHIVDALEVELKKLLDWYK